MSETTTTDPDTEDPTPDVVEDPDPTPTSQPVALSGTTEGATTMADTATDYTFSYEYGIDVNTGTKETPTWQTCRRVNDLAPTITPKSIDVATYDDEGADHPLIIGKSWSVSFSLLKLQGDDGLYQPEFKYLYDLATLKEKIGTAGQAEIRWYNKPAEGTPNPTDAFQGTGTVSVARANTGASDSDKYTFTITGQSAAEQIANPLTVTP